MRRLILAGGLLLAVAGCVDLRPKLAWDHYSECSAGSFVAMVDCGKARRTAYCQANPSECGSGGNDAVLYADSLKASVVARQMTDAEATRKWLEYVASQRQIVATSTPPETTVIIRR